MRLVWLLFAFVAFGLLLAGCTQNNTTTNNGNSSTPAAPAVTPPVVPVVPPVVVDAKADLARSLSLMNSTAWRAEYNVDAGSALPVTSMAMYRDGKGTFRYDLSTTEMNVRMYHLAADAAKAGVVCLSNSTLNWTCVKSSSLSSDLFSALGDNLTQETVVSLPSKMVAGTQTSCYNVTNRDQPGWGEACFSTGGALLFMQAAGKQTDGTTTLATFEATSYSASVSASDFVPPAKPLDTGGSGSG